MKGEERRWGDAGSIGKEGDEGKAGVRGEEAKGKRG